MEVTKWIKRRQGKLQTVRRKSSDRAPKNYEREKADGVRKSEGNII